MRFSSGEKSRPMSMAPGFIGLFGLMWTVFSAGFVIAGLVGDQPFMALFGGLFVLIGVVMIGLSGFIYFSRFRIGRPEIILSEQILRVGQRFTAQYSHTFKRKVSVDQIVMQLIFRETATYQRGTDTTTVVHDELIEEYVAAGGIFSSGHPVAQSYQMQIPRSAMHSLECPRNKLEWFVRFQIQVPRLPDYVHLEKLEVVSEMEAQTNG